MAKWGATSFESELTVRLGNDRRIRGADLTRWRRGGLWYVARFPRMTAFTRTQDISINPGTTSSTLNTDVRAIYQVQEIRPNRHGLRMVPRGTIDRRTFSAGDVNDVARQGRTLYWGNSVDAGTAFRVTYQATPTLPSGTATAPYDEEWDDVAMERATYLGLKDLSGEERASVHKALLDELVAERGYDPRRVERICSIESIESGAKSVGFRIRTE